MSYLPHPTPKLFSCQFLGKFLVLVNIKIGKVLLFKWIFLCQDQNMDLI